MISAQVIIKPSSGKEIRINEIITSENIHLYLPEPKVAAALKEYFNLNNFKTGPVVGISFSIEATASHFENFFGTELIIDKTRGIEIKENKKKELPLDTVPVQLKRWLVSIIFPTPPEYFEDSPGQFL